MNFKAHAIAGSISGISMSLFAYHCSDLIGYHSLYHNLEKSIFFGLITLGASLAPDIDTGSFSSRIFAWIGIISSCILIYLNFPLASAIIGIVYMAFSSDKHRGFTHKWALPISSFIVFIIANVFWLLSFSIGLITHYIVDRIPPYKIL